MLLHYLKLSFRNLRAGRVFSLINIGGLSIALAGCILIGLYVYTQIGFDRFHRNHRDIYRIDKVMDVAGKPSSNDAITPGRLGDALPAAIPEVAAATRFRPWFTDMLVSYDTLHLALPDVAYTDNTFLRMFDFPLVSGDRRSALAEPFTAVITESAARKYFRDANPIGKVLTTLNNIPVRITGVARDVPGNSSIRFSLLISWATIQAPSSQTYFFWMDSWTTNVAFTFVQLRRGGGFGAAGAGAAAAKIAGAKINALQHKHRDETEFKYRLYLQPLDDIHLHSSDILYAEAFQTNGARIVYALGLVAGFILLIACFNFVNLSTAGALARARETGVQKVLGARRGQLVGQFFVESALLCLAAMILAILMTISALPAFEKLVQTPLDMGGPKVWLAMGALLIGVCLMAGLYPALFLSSFRSGDLFRSTVSAGKRPWLRRTLVTTQFALSILLMIGTIGINRQLHFLADKDLGFDQDHVVVLQLANTAIEHKTKAFIDALRGDPYVVSVTASNRVPGDSFNGFGIIPEGHNLGEHLLAQVLETDAGFATTYGLQIDRGRFFDPATPSDTQQAIVVNEALVRYLDWKNPIGKKLELYQSRKGRIVGVIKDFNYASLHMAVQPLAIILNDNPLYVSVKFRGGSLDRLGVLWKRFDAETPFTYQFLDQRLRRFYQSDTRLLQVLSLFAGLAMSIACMGLFGLSIYSTRQRTKEIGIRKVLGASVQQIALLVSGDFLRLVGLAALVAFPLAGWLLYLWLQDYAYRIHLGWGMFALAGLLAFTVAAGTIGIYAIRAALANPVQSLRTE